jgi:hypothetical protein
MKKTMSLVVLHKLGGDVSVHELGWCVLVGGTVLAGGMMWCMCPEGWVVCVHDSVFG